MLGTSHGHLRNPASYESRTLVSLCVLSIPMEQEEGNQTRVESIFKLYLQLSQWQKVVWKKKKNASFSLSLKKEQIVTGGSSYNRHFYWNTRVFFFQYDQLEIHTRYFKKKKKEKKWRRPDRSSATCPRAAGAPHRVLTLSVSLWPAQTPNDHTKGSSNQQK